MSELRTAKTMIDAIIYGLAWAGVVMLYDFAMWEGGILDKWWTILNECNLKFLGSCEICFCFWFGLWYSAFDLKNYFVFAGFSMMAIIFYHLLKLFLKK